MTAVAHGLPILASAIGGLQGAVRGRARGAAGPPGDARALAEVLSEWAEAPDALGRHADAMRTTRSLMPSWSEIARRTIGVYATARETWLAERDENAAYTQNWN